MFANPPSQPGSCTPTRRGCRATGRLAIAGLAAATIAIVTGSAIAAPPTSEPEPPATTDVGTVPSSTDDLPPSSTAGEVVPTSVDAPSTVGEVSPPTSEPSLPPPSAPPSSEEPGPTDAPSADVQMLEVEPFDVEACSTDAVGDSYAMDAGATLVVAELAGILQNDVLCPGATEHQITVAPSSGTLTLTGGGGFEYTADPGDSGFVMFTYALIVEQVVVDTAQVTILVADCSVVANADVYATTFDAPITIPAPGFLTNDTLGCSPVSVSQMFQPLHGSVTDLQNGSFTYQPDPGFFGVDKFQYVLRDADQFLLAIGTVHVVVAGPPCVASLDSYSVQGDSVLQITAPGVLANDTFCSDFDPNNDYVALGADGPDHGELDLEGDGSFEYTPDPGYVGPDSFTYDMTIFAPETSSDGEVVATGTVLINVAEDVCIAVDDFFTVEHDDTLTTAAPGVLVNDTQCSDSFLTQSLFEPPSHGTAQFAGDGSFEYTPDPGFVGQDTIVYRLSKIDITNPSQPIHLATATVHIDVVETCALALADDNYDMVAGADLHVSAPGPGHNDTLCGDPPLQVVDEPDHGSLTLLGGGDLTYTPDAGFVGTDAFTYTVEQPMLGFAGRSRPAAPQPSLLATVTINVSQTAPSTTSTTVSDPADPTTTTVSAGPTSIPSPTTTTTAAPPSGELPQTGGGGNGLVVAIAAVAIAVGCFFRIAFRRLA